MNRIKNFLTANVEKMALKNWQTYKFAQEWLWCILICLILKLVTAAFSIFSGFFYLDNFFFGLTNSTGAAHWWAFLALFIIEGLAAVLLGKFFKFALRCQLLTAAGPLVGVVIIFSISFIVSTNGIALFTSNNVDNSQTINAKYNLVIDNIKTDQDATIAVINDQIETIRSNPSEWRNGKRDVLSAAQLQHIQDLYYKIEISKSETNDIIKEIESRRDKDLAENTANTMSEAGRFYKIAAFIMIVQFFLSGILMFFWSKITAYKAPEIAEREAYNNAESNIVNMVRDGFGRVISAEFLRYNTMFADIASNAQQTLSTQPAQPIAAKTEQKKFGFFIPDAPNNNEKSIRHNPNNGCDNNADKAVFTPQLQTLSDAPTAAVGGSVATSETAAKKDVITELTTVHYCQFCGVALTPSQVAHRAKFCCPEHRRANWEKENGKKLQTIPNDSLDK